MNTYVLISNYVLNNFCDCNSYAQRRFSFCISVEIRNRLKHLGVL